MNLKKQLETLLDSQAMTAAQLSRRSGVPKQVLSDWLKNKSPRNLDHIKRVADALDVSVDLLLFGEGADYEKTQTSDLGALVGDQWFGGLFEVRLRRVTRGKDDKK